MSGYDIISDQFKGQTSGVWCVTSHYSKTKMHPARMRLLLSGTRAVYLAPALPRSQFRCLSSVGGAARLSDETQNENSSKSSTLFTSLGAAGAVTSGLCLAWYFHTREKRHTTGHKTSLPHLLPQLRASGNDKREEKPKEKVSVRERRYKDFSSVQFRGEPYMTPRDFLESVTLDEPRRKLQVGDLIL